MTDKPILFSAPMIRALLAGTKTQTRRKLPAAHPKFPENNILSLDVLCDPQEVWYWDGKYDRFGASYRIPIAPGDRLWVREAHYLTDDGTSEYAVYAEDADDVQEHLRQMEDLQLRCLKVDWSKHLRKRSPIHMPRWASRLTLTVTDVRVQRLQEISRDEAIAEGLQLESDNIEQFWRWPKPHDARIYLSPIVAFRDLWNSIHGPDAWAANPWVAAYTFTVHRCNIDQMGT